MKASPNSININEFLYDTLPLPYSPNKNEPSKGFDPLNLGIEFQPVAGPSVLLLHQIFRARLNNRELPFRCEDFGEFWRRREKI